jgi:hypothetical protein
MVLCRLATRKPCFLLRRLTIPARHPELFQVVPSLTNGTEAFVKEILQKAIPVAAVSWAPLLKIRILNILSLTWYSHKVLQTPHIFGSQN